MLGLWKKISPRIETIEDEKDPLYPSQFDEDDSSHTGQNHPVKKQRNILLLLNLVLFASLLASLFLSIVPRGEMTDKNAAFRQLNAYSPMLKDIEIEYSMKQMQGSVIDVDHSIFRQPPSPAVDAAWNNLSNLNSIWISSSEILKMGKDPQTVAHFPEEFGLGPDAYAGELDILHKIHCLNFLRREIYFDYYLSDKFPDGKVSALHAAHTSHCLHMLLQHLVCDANTEVVTKDWVDGQIYPFPDFSINRKCGDFAAIMKWQEGRRVPNDLFRPWRKPKDVVPLPVSEEFAEVFGYNDPEFTGGHEYHHD